MLGTNIDEKWANRFCELANHIAQWSKDESTKVGCVLVDPHTRTIVSLGYNGFPRRVHETPERTLRPTKYLFFEHAERNALYNAIGTGAKTVGCWAFVNWDPKGSVCSDCARALIQCGISVVVGPSVTVQGREDVGKGWRDNCQQASLMFKEARVAVLTLGVDHG